MVSSKTRRIIGIIICIFVADLLYERQTVSQETLNNYEEKADILDDDNINEESVNTLLFEATINDNIVEESVITDSYQTADKDNIDKEYMDNKIFLTTEDDSIGDILLKSDGNSGEDQKLSHNLTNVLDLPTTGNAHSIWSNDSQCSSFQVKFSSGLPLVWLASFPRSGNTWTRYLIEAATGVWTNSIYNDPKNTQLGYLGEMEPVGTGRCVVSKTHIWKHKKHIPTILVIRNPAKSIVSFWNFHIAPNRGPKSNKYFFNASNKTYESPGFRKWVKSSTRWWRDVTARYLKMSQKLMVIYYEELCKDPITHMHGVLKFLGLQEDPARMACVAKFIDGKAKGAQREIDPYTAEEKTKLRQAIEYVRGVAHERGIKLPDYAKLI